MGWTLSADVDSFARQVSGLLASRPVENNVALTLVDEMRGGRRFSGAPMTFGWWSSRGVVEGAVLMTPPHPLLLIQTPLVSLGELAGALRERGTDVPMVNGAAEAVDAFATSWTALTGRPAVLHQHHRLYQLDSLDWPHPLPEGAPRVATAAEADLLTDWVVAFHVESGSGAGRQAAYVEERIRDRRLWIWQDVAGQPVSLAGRQRTTAGVGRVGPVYTPPQHRRRGYGSAVTAACTADALQDGAEHVVLFTDLANPTSNAIYLQLGYRPVSDRSLVRFIS